MTAADIKKCDECKSLYFADASWMLQLCPECSHVLYGYPSCNHPFGGRRRCIRCYWDRSESKVIRRIKREWIEEEIRLSALDRGKVDRLAGAAALLLKEHGGADKVAMSFPVYSNGRRLKLERTTSGGTRYFIIHPVDDPSGAWEFALLGGAYRCPNDKDNFDARYGGTEENILAAIKAWFVDLGEWNFPRPG